MDDKIIKKRIEDKNKRIEKFVDRKEIGLGLGAAMNCATQLLIAGIELTEENQQKLENWRNWIFLNQREKQQKEAEYEVIPVVEEKPAVPVIDIDFPSK